MARPPLKRSGPAPVNQSRAAGAPAPASAAATAPFYSPEEAAEAPPAAASELGGFASVAQEYASTVRAQAVDLDEGSADASLTAEVDRDAPPSRAEVERIRSMRKPLGTLSQKLALPPRRGYHQHWFNDAAGRVNEAEANGWAFVKDKDGKPLKRAVGTGRDNGVMYGFAMMIPEVFWLEDMAARHAQAEATIASTKANPFRAAPGSAKPSDKGKFYDPTESGAPLTVEVR